VGRIAYIFNAFYLKRTLHSTRDTGHSIYFTHEATPRCTAESDRTRQSGVASAAQSAADERRTDVVVEMWTTGTSNDEGRDGGSETERRGRRRQSGTGSSNKGDGGDGGGADGEARATAWDGEGVVQGWRYGAPDRSMTPSAVRTTPPRAETQRMPLSNLVAVPQGCQRIESCMVL
jgi:hypothetical protein